MLAFSAINKNATAQKHLKQLILAKIKHKKKRLGVAFWVRSV
jgi:hypothetical protein